MNFIVELTDTIPKYPLVYIMNEYSFYMENRIQYIDFELSVNNLDLTVVNGQIVRVSGYCPNKLWLGFDKNAPLHSKGRLKVTDALKSGINYKVNQDIDWEIHLNSKSGWICIGNPDDVGLGVEFIENCIAVIDNGNLKSLWLRPLWK